MLDVRGLVSCRSRVQASHLLRFPLTEVSAPVSGLTRLRAASSPAVAPRILPVGPSQPYHRRFSTTPDASLQHSDWSAPQGRPPHSEEFGAPLETQTPKRPRS